MTSEELLKTFDLTPIDARMILVGVVVFFIFWRLFDRIVFRPYLALFNQREALTAGAKGSSKDILEQASQIDREVEEAMHQARVAAIASKLEVMNAAKAEAATITQQAESEVHASLQEARSKREQGYATAKQQILTEAQALANEVVARLTAN